MENITKYLLGPRLYRIYTLEAAETEGQIYGPNGFESLANSIIKGVNILWNVSLYASPFIICYMYKKDCFCVTGCVSMCKLATGMSILLGAAMIMRGIGRSTNTSYNKFLFNLIKCQKHPNSENKETLRKYDFDLSAWPVDFSYTNVEGERNKPKIQLDRYNGQNQFGSMKWVLGMPCNLLAWSCMHVFGRPMIYPGSTQVLQSILAPMLETGRARLVMTYGGHRNKLQVRDGNFIDTMFVDRRKDKSFQNGSTLVVCCEGNAGFYEIGLMNPALEAGYSVLGWNHPGFGGSTGEPFPTQEQNAIDGVMQFAIQKLGFKQFQIIIYAWSIGGYIGAWAAMNYPEIKGIIMDASFDDIMPIAISKMPSWMGGLIQRGIRNYMNLNVADHLCQYHGPITIIRRTDDEIITVVEGDISTNRGNDLLMKILKARFPELFLSSVAVNEVNKWIAEQPPGNEIVYRKADVDDKMCWEQLVAYVVKYSLSYPLLIGEDWNDQQKTKLLLYLANKYLLNVKMCHNNPLEAQYLRIQWEPFNDADFGEKETYD